MRSTARVVTTLAGLVVGLALAAPGSAGAALFATTISYQGPALIAQGEALTLSATMTDGGFVGIAGRTVTLTLGAGADRQSCTATTDAWGEASCDIAAVTVGLGPQAVIAKSADDAFYSASSDTSTAIVYAVNSSFVLGDQTVRFAASGATVEFWGADWFKANALSRSDVPPAFKGFAAPTGPLTSCGGSWTARPGNSAGAPDALPAYMAVIVSSKITQSGGTISGDVDSIVIVKTDPGYGSSPGRHGTGRIVGRMPCAGPQL